MSATPRPPLLKRVPQWVWRTTFALLLALYPAALVRSYMDQPGGIQDANHRVFILVAVVSTFPLIMLRRFPLTAVTILSCGVALVLVRLPNEGGAPLPIYLAVAFSLGRIAALHPRQVSVTAAVLPLVPIFAFTRDGMLFMLFLSVVVSWTIGNSVHQRRVYAEALRSHATDQAVTAERLRIARELHDMVAHSIGIIAIQAGVGSRVIDTRPEEARKALSAVETTSRETLAGLRRMLVALRTADGSGAPMEVTPGLADLDRLVAAARDAGVEVDVRRTGQERALPAELELSAFRIVQEAVTNVVRHAGTKGCRVLLDNRAEELFVEITDDGTHARTPDGTGYGLVGMRERVALLHGEFSAGPRPGGGFRVAALLPVPGEGL